MKFDVMTLFPEMVNTVLQESILGRGQKAGCFTARCHNIRDYSENKHRRVDDTPYGGGMGMVMAAPPVYSCWRSIVDAADAGERIHTVYLSPKGAVFHQEKAAQLLSYDRVILLCGHYEGVDERVLSEIVDEEISVGDYVLTGGELPACIVIDAVARMIEGVLPSPECYEEESISSGLLEYPHYTRPPVFHGREVPAVLLSGNHKDIENWRRDEAFRITDQRRPDLISEEMRLAEEARHAPKKKKKRRKPDAEESENNR